MSRKRKSKGFKMKSPIKSGGLALGRVLTSPRASTASFTASDSGGGGAIEPTYEYSIWDATQDITAGKLTKEEAFKKYKESRKKGKSLRA